MSDTRPAGQMWPVMGPVPVKNQSPSPQTGWVPLLDMRTGGGKHTGQQCLAAAIAHQPLGWRTPGSWSPRSIGGSECCGCQVGPSSSRQRHRGEDTQSRQLPPPPRAPVSLDCHPGNPGAA